METIVPIISAAIYAGVILFARVNPYWVTFRGRPDESPTTAMLLMAFIYPFLGLIFKLMSLITGYIGWFLYSPIEMLWQHAT